jgi:hypothetical protein
VVGKASPGGFKDSNPCGRIPTHLPQEISATQQKQNVKKQIKNKLKNKTKTTN